MYYVDKLLSSPKYLDILKDTERLEADRIYCRHGLSHALDVCRIAWILCLEDLVQGTNALQKNNGPEAADVQEDDEILQLYDIKETIYLSGLLHDIGRAAQYRGKAHHIEAGVQTAKELLADIGCPDKKTEEVLTVISEHAGRCSRGVKKGDGTSSGLKKEGGSEASSFSELCKDRIEKGDLSAYIKRADHISRNCFACAAYDTCKWAKAQRNETIRY